MGSKHPKKAAPGAAVAEKSGPACATMTVKQGKLTSTVTCSGSAAATEKCKAMCGP